MCKSCGFQSFSDRVTVLPLFHPSRLPPHTAYCVLQPLSLLLHPFPGSLTEIVAASLP